MTHSLSIIWNPSQGIDLSFFTIHYYSLMFVVSFTTGWFLMKKIFEREKETIATLDSLFIWTVIATLAGARLGQVFFYDWPYFKDHLLEIFLPFQFSPTFKFTGFRGLASHGAALAIIITMYFFSKNVLKKPILWILDRIVIPVSSGAVFVRFGNFFNSEILGHETNSVFGVRFLRDRYSEKEAIAQTHISNPNEAHNAIANNPQFANLLAQVPAKHPAQLYEAAGYIIIFAVVLYYYWKTDARNKPGLLLGIFLVLLWSVRFMVEFVKESQGGFENDLGFLSTGQWLSIPFIIIGLYLIIFAKRKPVE